MVTDYDCWHPSHKTVSVDQIIKVLNQNNLKSINLIKEISKEPKISCDINSEKVLKEAILSDLGKAPEDALKKLKYILPHNENR